MVVSDRVLSMGQIDVLKLFIFNKNIWCHITKLFVLRIVTCSYNCLLRVIISYLKPYNYATKWLLLNRYNYLKPYSY